MKEPTTVCKCGHHKSTHLSVGGMKWRCPREGCACTMFNPVRTPKVGLEDWKERSHTVILSEQQEECLRLFHTQLKAKLEVDDLPVSTSVKALITAGLVALNFIDSPDDEY